MSRFLRASLATLLVLFMAVPVSAAGGKSNTMAPKTVPAVQKRTARETAKKVKRTDRYSPAHGNEVELQVWIKWFEDNTGMVSVTGWGMPRLQLTYDLKLDPASLTYRATRVVPASSTVSNPGKNDQAVVQAEQLYTGSLTLTTKDPAFVPLAETYGRLYWIVDNGQVTWDTMDGQCTAWNPTALGTHWYTSGCYEDSWFTSSEATGTAEGHYYNYDGPPLVGDPNEPTYIDHYIDLYGQTNGMFRYTFRHPVSGEAWGLLNTTVSVGN